MDGIEEPPVTEKSSAAKFLRAVVGFVTGVTGTVAAYAASTLAIEAVSRLTGILIGLGYALVWLPVAALVLGGCNAARSRRLPTRGVATELAIGTKGAVVLGYAVVELLYAGRGGA